MVTRLYKLDHVGGDYVSTLMGEYATDADAKSARDAFSKTHTASWMISTGRAEVRRDGSAVKIAAL